MNPRARALTIAAGTVAVVFSLSAWGLYLGLTRPSGVELSFEFGSAPALFFVSQTVFAVVGAVILVRRNDNRMGRLFCLAAIVATTVNFSEQYAIQALIVDPGSLPAGRAMAWMTIAPGFTIMLAFASLVALYPDGRLPGPRWRPFLWLLVLGVGLAAAGSIASWPYRGVALLRIQEATIPGADLANLFLTGTFVVSAATVVLAIAAIVVRYRRGASLTRLQIKWFAYAAAISVLGVFGTTVPAALNAANVVTGVGAVGVPVAAGMAILRYRLYDIDRIINRTIVYALVTGLAVAVYSGTVFVIGTVVVGSADNLTVAVATLAAAAIFRPALRRVQTLVDRRFYRHKYDAQHTIDAFGARLREETNIDELTGDLVSVVRTTMQPEHVSVWLISEGAELR
jgi:hypothetical protein